MSAASGARRPPPAESVDVVVVGFGGAGACAAIEAARAGAKVLVLERFGGGGATRLSGGVIYAGGGTGPQRAAGVADDVEQMVRYLGFETGGAVDQAVLRAFCEQSRESIAWLESLGLSFPPRLFPAKTTQPPDGYGLYHSGNEQPYAKVAIPAARGHVPCGKGMAGPDIFAALEKAAREAGVEARTHAKVVGLLQEGGKVAGVEVDALAAGWLHSVIGSAGMAGGPFPGINRALERAGRRRRYSVAAKAVVLAAGGFVFNRPMMRRCAPAYAGCLPLGTLGDDGSGIELGQSVGADVAAMDSCAASRFICPPEAFVGGVLVNLKGERFCDESLYGATLSAQISRQPEGKAWLVIDSRQRREAKRQLREEEESVLLQPVGEVFSGRRNALIFRKVTGASNLHLNRRKAKTLAALGARLGMPAGALERTVAEYNACIAERRPDPHGKGAEHAAPIGEAPFFAIDCRLDTMKFPSPCLTLGGLKVDGLTGQAQRADGSPIEGLYAAGRNAAGVCARSYVSGLSIADCIFSGRNAGRAAARAAAASSKTAA